MTSTYTANNGIEKIETGDQSGTWGETTNTNFDIIDRALNGVGSITLSGTSHTLTTTDGSLTDGMFKVLSLAGSPTGTNTITISPNDQDKLYFVTNASGQSAVFSQGTGANVTIPNGGADIIFADGAGSGAAVSSLFASTVTFGSDVLVGDDLTLNSDSAVLGFGADTDTTLTHTDGSGLTLNSTNKLMFGDSGTFIHQSADGVLDLVSDTEIEINATTIDINGAVDISGNITGGGNLDVSSGTIKLDGNYPTGTSNVALGDTALDSVEAGGTHNTAIGATAGTAITTGDSNTVVGSGAGDAIATVNDNTAVGFNALTVAVTAQNTAIGSAALQAYAPSSGDGSTAVGYAAGATTTTNAITAVGREAGFHQTGASNTFVGSSTGKGTGASTAASNTGVGDNALTALATGGTNNVAVGHGAGQAITTGDNNNCMGQSAGPAINSGSQNIAIGNAAGQNETTGSDNTLVGHGAGFTQNTKSQNTFIGSQAGYTSNGGTLTYIGFQAGYYGTSPTTNSAVGYQAMKGSASSAPTGNSNTAVGYLSMTAIAGAGQQNTAVGSNTLQSLTTAEGQTVLGHQAGTAGSGGAAVVDGFYNTLIGMQSMASASNAQHQIVLGSFQAVGQGNNTFTFGKSGSQVTNTFTSNANFSQSSDQRLKTNIEDNDLGLDFINDLKTKTYNWLPSNQVPEELTSHYSEENQKDTEVKMWGMLAQQVKEAMDNHGSSDFTGWLENSDGSQNISREMFIIPLIKAVQELTKKVEELEAKLDG